MSVARLTSRMSVPAGDAAHPPGQLQLDLARGAIPPVWAALAHRPSPPSRPSAPADPSQWLRAQELFDFSLTPSVSTDLTGIIVEANHAAAALFRTRKEFLIGKPLLLFVCKQDRSAHYSLLLGLRRGDGDAMGLPTRLSIRHGLDADVLLWTSGVPDERGGLIGIRWLFQDISAVTRAEKALSDERDFAEGLLETAEAIVLVLDEGGRIVRANSYLRRIPGRDDGGLLGLAWRSLVSEEDAPRMRAALLDALHLGTTPPFTTGLETPSGRVRLIAWSLRAVSHGPDRGAVLVVGQDLTDLHEARGQVVQAERLAALGRMMAVQAHESRNLLQRGTACLDRLEWRLEGNADAIDLVRRAQQALASLGRLYEDVRTVAGPLSIVRSPCDLRAVWRDAFADSRAVHAGREAELVEDVREADPRCEADAFRLGQVFRNLFDNAFDACPAGLRVEIRCRETPDGGLAVSVRDNGPGLSPEQRGRLFELFYTTKDMAQNNFPDRLDSDTSSV